MALITCPECEKEVSSAAQSCPNCGYPVNSSPPKTAEHEIVAPSQAAPSWSPGIAALLSLIIPGGGQMYKGQVIGGLVWFIAVLVGYFIFIVPGLLLHLICIISAARKEYIPVKTELKTDSYEFLKEDTRIKSRAALNVFSLLRRICG
mgnify:CR=1 FL=1